MATPGAHSAAHCAATPKSAIRRSLRRSWFDTPPATPLDIAVEKQPLKTMGSQSKRRSIEDVETLVLSHFTKPPRISFGKIIVGRSKTRMLLVQNPADYEQEVVIERFPFKKCFNVDQRHFMVEPEEVVTLTLTWTPQDAGGCREMVLFHVNDVYRLQAYVFGTADDPKPVKKGRRGMLGTRRKQPPSSVVQTKSLNSIRDNYSPRKSEEMRELCSHIKPTHTQHIDQENVRPAELEELIPQTPPPLESTAISRSDERQDQKAMERRKSGFISPTLSKMSPIPMMADNNNGCIMESYIISTAGHTPPTLAGKEAERNPLKNVSGNEIRMSNSPNNAAGRSNRDSGGGRSGIYRSKRSSEQDKSVVGRSDKMENAIESKTYVSPNSFLNDSIAGKTTASTLAEIGTVRASTQMTRVAEMATVSPNSFMEAMGNKQSAPVAPTASSIPSPSTVLNDSIPHNIMMRQLEYVRKSLHDGSFHESSVPSSLLVTRNKPASKPCHPARVMDRLSQLAQPKARNVFVHAQQQTAAGKKEKVLQRKIREKARFAKITDVPSPRRKTFLVTKKQQNRKVSPVKSQSQSTKPGKKSAALRLVSRNQFTSGNLRRQTLEMDDVRINSQTVNKAHREKEVVSTEPNNRVTFPDHHDEAITQDDAVTQRCRSLWASPAVTGFVSPVLATRSDCDSMEDEMHILENAQDEMSSADHQQHQSRVSAQHVNTTIEVTDIPKTASKEVDNKAHRSSGRRLFPDAVSDNLNLSKEFRPLWSGSATVTKDRPSISPQLSGSANCSKKLFPDINITVPSGLVTKTTPGNGMMHHGQEGEDPDVEGDMKKAGIVDMTQGPSQPPKGKTGKPDVEKTEIVVMAVTGGPSPERNKEKSDAHGENADIDMAAAASQSHRGKKGKLGLLFDDHEGLQEKSAYGDEQMKNLSSFEWHSPQQLQQSPVSEPHRRTTLTVTKSRPSQVLLDACNNAADQGVTTETQEATPVADGKQNESDELWQTETIVIETRNNAVVSLSVHREVLTPSELPTSPISENSRRSTHSVRNPVVLNKDGFVPKNLFGTISESKNGGGETESEELNLKDKDQTSDASQEKNTEQSSPFKAISSSRRGMVPTEDDSSASTLTERVEKHIKHQRDKVVRPAQFFTQLVLDSSVCSQELSTDSLESEKKISISGHVEEDSMVDGRDTEPSTGRSGQASADEICMDEQACDVNRKNSTHKSSLPHTLSSEHCRAQESYSHQPTTKDNSKILSEVKETVESKGEQQKELVSHSQEDLSESFPEITPVPSVISAGSKAVVTEGSGQHSEKYKGLPDAPVRETSAKPLTSCDVVREALLKKGLVMTMDRTAETVSSTHDNSALTSLYQGQLTKSLSGDLRSNSVQPSLTRKPPVGFTFKQTSASNHKVKTVSAAQFRDQSLPRTRSQGSLDCIKQTKHENSLDGSKETERLNRKRTSPKAGLKPPHSKRVELDSSVTGRKSQQIQSRGTTTGRPKGGRAAKPSRGVALSKLILIKKSKTALPKHPLPFAAKNMYYDERWQDKQERGFVHWLNFVLTPADEYVLATTKTKVDARTITFDGTAHKMAPRLAPTKEILSFRAYAARRRLNHLRRASCRLFQSEAVVRVVCRLELEVEQRRLAVRTDRMIHADIGLKQKILDMLLSYNPLWLRIGLETVYGEVLPIQTNSDVIGMSRFILTRLLTSPDISAHYAHPTVPHLYHDGYADAVAQHTLKKVLVLVYFLDCAKQSRLIAHDPCLFCKDAEIKSTKGLLIQFSRDFLSGEGDITKHLAYMGYIVSHAQTPLDEFDYAVTNLCTDLRDGLRLGRIIVLLSGDWSFSTSLRAPAISRLQKIHNVELVFKQLTQRGLDLHTAKGGSLNPRDIVDGHREKTLAFLWKLIFHFQTVAMLNEQELQEEVDILERTLRVKVCMQRLLSHPHNSNSAARRDSGGASVTMDSPMLQLLLKWCRTVCLHYGVKVENFTVSFSDGRALCCLLHHYHPALLPLTDIHFRTSQSVQEAAEYAEDRLGDDDSELSQEWDANRFGGELDQSLFETLLASEKENFRTLYEKVSELGGIPLMLKAVDMSNTIPDERVVVTYISYLCARLLDLREETRAARIVQLAWRRFCLRRSARLQQKQIAACMIIQHAWRQHLAAMATRRQEAAATHLQALWRGRQVRQRVAILKQANINFAMHEAATRIQSFVRCFLTRLRFQRQIHSAVTIQSWLRAQRSQRVFIRQQQACVTIQTHFRAYREGIAVRQQFMSQKQSVIFLQRAFRMRQLRQLQNQNSAVCLLQSVWRGRRCRQKFLHQKQAAICVQAWWRACQAQTHFLKLKTASTIVQRQFRATRLASQTRRDFLQIRQATVTLQKYMRGSHQHRQFSQWKNSALILQKNFRCYRYRVKFQALRLATVIIQRAVRAHQARNVAQQRFITLRRGTVIVQRWFRQQTQRQAAKRRAAAVVIQAYVRGYHARRQAEVIRNTLKREAAAITIQNFYRTTMVHRQLQAFQLEVRKNRAAVKIQAGFHGFVARRSVQLLRLEARREQASITIQSAYRCYRAIKELRVLQTGARQESAAMKIQSAYHHYTVRKRFRAALLLARRERAAIRIQSLYRRYLAVRELRALQLQTRRQSAAVIIQSAYRRHLAVRELRSLQLEARRQLAAVKIQSACQRYLAVRQLRVLQHEAKRQSAVLKIQSAYRLFQAVKQLRMLQLDARREASAVKIQAMYRGHVARSYVHTLRERIRQDLAAMKIQAFFRGCHERKQYLAVQHSALLLQTYARGHLARQCYQQMREALLILAEYYQTQEKFQAVIAEYHQRWSAAVTVQAAWRGWWQRQQFIKTKSCICKLQATIRGHAQRECYLLLRQSVLVVQRQFRAYRCGQATRLKYRLMVGAAVVIQSCWKMYVIRSYYLQLRARVICAQAHGRRFLARTRFLRQRKAAVCLQRRFRAWKLSQEAQRDYQKSQQSIIRLQAIVRGNQQYKHFHRQRLSYVRIQSAMRGWLARRCYQTQRRSVIMLQRWWRASVQSRKERQRYTVIRSALITIQSYTRGHLTRQHIRSLQQAACVIQRHYRGYQSRHHFLCLRQATVTLQQHVKAFLLERQQRKDFTLTRQACVTIQSAYRGYMARQRYMRFRQSVVRLQSIVRGWQQRLKYLAVYRATLVCQNHYRAKCLGLVFRTAYLMIRDATLTIQKYVRGYRVRQEYQRQKSAAVTIQAHVRDWLQRRQVEAAAVCLQRWWREQKMVRVNRQNFLHTRQAAITIQRAWRALLLAQLQNRHNAATVIQTHFRRHLVQTKFQSDRLKIIRLQANVRGFLVRRSVSEQLRVVTVIQRRWRETRMARQCRHNFLLTLGAAVVIQSVFRGHCTRVYFALAVKRIILLQTTFRGCLQRRKYLQLRQTVVWLQRRMRVNRLVRQERHCFLQQRRSAVCIQRAFRRWQKRQEELKTQATICLQSYIRMLPVRRRFLRMKKAVTVLQAAVRGHHARHTLQQKKDAILFIQHRVRYYLLVRQLRHAVHRRQQAATSIQQVFRKHLARERTRKTEAAIKIQAVFRGFAQRQKFLRQKQATLTLQCGLRGWRERQRVTEMRAKVKATVLIQRCFRDWKWRREEQLRRAQRAEYLKRYMRMVECHLAVLRIQRWYRQALMMRRAGQQLHYVIVIQRRVRAFLQRVRYLRAQQEARELCVRQARAAIVIQSAVRKWLPQQEEKRRIRLITKVQAVWRGRQLRCGLKSKKIAAARRRVQKANERATEETKLGNRTASALDFLLHYKQLAYILDALMHLDVATRLSWVCCERLVEVNAVGVIYRLILSCNRSLPHMELIKYSVSVLLNLAKYEKTSLAVYEAEDSVTTLVDLMSIYREKGGAIFTKTCMLLGILGSEPQRKAEMCADKRLVGKLQSIHALVLRKHHMQVARARVAARTSLNTTLPSRLHGPRSIKVQPAWVLRRDSMHDIEDPLAALSFLLDTLHIGPK